MPAQRTMLVTPATARSPQYDVQIALTEDFLNRALALGITTGVLPSSFQLTFGAAEDPLGLAVRTDLNLSVSNIAFFSEGDATQLVGLRATWAGSVTVRVTLAEWTLSPPNGPYIDPGLDQTFTIPFDGEFSATADVLLQQVGDNCVLTISFARLDQLDIAKIGSLTPGVDFTEVIRAILERMAVMALRDKIKFPALNALPGSLTAPAKALLDSQSAQIGATDFKVTARADVDAPDELQLLLQAQQNLGQQSYQSVLSISESGGDIAIALSTRFLTQVLQDLWTGDAIPTRFDDKGQPSSSGPIWIERLSFAAMDSGKLQLRVFAQRKVVGLPITVNATLEFQPTVSAGRLFANDVSVHLDVNLDWG